MKVAATTQVPSLAGKVDPRFGRSRFLVLVDTDTGRFTTLENAHDFGGTQGAGTGFIREAVEEGVEAVISGCLPPKGLVALRARGIGIHIGAHGTVTDAVRQFKSGGLVCLSTARAARPSVSRTEQQESRERSWLEKRLGAELRERSSRESVAKRCSVSSESRASS